MVSNFQKWKQQIVFLWSSDLTEKKKDLLTFASNKRWHKTSSSTSAPLATNCCMTRFPLNVWQQEEMNKGLYVLSVQLSWRGMVFFLQNTWKKQLYQETFDGLLLLHKLRFWSALTPTEITAMKAPFLSQISVKTVSGRFVLYKTTFQLF